MHLAVFQCMCARSKCGERVQKYLFIQSRFKFKIVFCVA